LQVTTNIPLSDWKQFTENHPGGSVFQMPGMFEIFEKTDKFDPLVLGAYDKNDTLCGILLGVFIHERNGLVKLLSSRFVIYGGPLLLGDDELQKESLDALLKELIEQTRKKALFIQFRNLFSWEEHLPVFEQNGFGLLDRLNFILDTSDRKGLLKNMSASRRRQIRKGLNSGAEIVEAKNIAQIKEFYHLLYRLYRYKVKKPLPDWSFFENFYEQSLNKSRHPVSGIRNPIGIIRLIRYQNKIIGGILAPVFEDKCIYEWYVCGLDKEYKEQHPSVLATWAAIDYALNNDIQTFDFMGVGKPDIAYGVRDFKARFGGKMVNYGRLTRINNSFLYHIAELGYNVLGLFKKI